jgi:hypothetical protein
MIMDWRSVALEKAADPAQWNPIQAKVRLEWGTHHLSPVDYSVRNACMGSMYAARRAGIRAAINPITESVTATAT